MHDGPFCDDYNIVYNKVKSWVQENFLVSLCLDLPASSIPAIKECFALHLYFTSSSFYFLIFILLMYYCQVIHMKMVKIGFKSLLLITSQLQF